MSAVRVEPIAIPACRRCKGRIFGGFGWGPRSAIRGLDPRLAADRMCFRTAARRQRDDARVETARAQHQWTRWSIMLLRSVVERVSSGRSSDGQ